MAEWKPSYFGGEKERSRKVETLEDALFAILCRKYCGGTDCNQCALNLFERGCSASEEANDFIKSFFLGNRESEITDLNGINAQRKLYEVYASGQACQMPGESKETKGHSCGTSCAACLYSQEHTSGILWCKSFGNFVHDDGYCYRWKGSDKIEAPQEVVPEKKSKTEAIEYRPPREDEWQVLPF